MENRKSPAPLDEALFKKLHEGLVKAFDNAVYYSNNSGIGSDARMRAAQASAQIADTLMRLQDRKPL